jgi:hypothetical protein
MVLPVLVAALTLLAAADVAFGVECCPERRTT